MITPLHITKLTEIKIRFSRLVSCGLSKSLISSIDFKVSEDTEYAMIGENNGRSVIYLSPKVLDNLSTSQIVSVVMHELMHKTSKHISRMKNWTIMNPNSIIQMTDMNLFADYIIDGYLFDINVHKLSDNYFLNKSERLNIEFDMTLFKHFVYMAMYSNKLVVDILDEVYKNPSHIDQLRVMDEVGILNRDSITQGYYDFWKTCKIADENDRPANLFEIGIYKRSKRVINTCQMDLQKINTFFAKFDDAPISNQKKPSLQITTNMALYMRNFVEIEDDDFRYREDSYSRPTIFEKRIVKMSLLEMFDHFEKLHKILSDLKLMNYEKADSKENENKQSDSAQTPTSDERQQCENTITSENYKSTKQSDKKDINGDKPSSVQSQQESSDFLSSLFNTLGQSNGTPELKRMLNEFSLVAQPLGEGSLLIDTNSSNITSIPVDEVDAYMSSKFNQLFTKMYSMINAGRTGVAIDNVWKNPNSLKYLQDEYLIQDQVYVEDIGQKKVKIYMDISGSIPSTVAEKVCGVVRSFNTRLVDADITFWNTQICRVEAITPDLKFPVPGGGTDIFTGVYKDIINQMTNHPTTQTTVVIISDYDDCLINRLSVYSPDKLEEISYYNLKKCLPGNYNNPYYQILNVILYNSNMQTFSKLSVGGKAANILGFTSMNTVYVKI